MSDNPFDAFGDTGHKKVNRKAQRQAEALEAVRKEKRDLGKHYRRETKAWKRRTLVLPGGDDVLKLIRQFHRIDDPVEFENLGLAMIPWIMSLHRDLQFYFLKELGRIVFRRKQRADLDPMDDDYLGRYIEPDTKPPVLCAIQYAMVDRGYV